MSVKEQVRRLWKLCFGDPDGFVDLYFGTRYSDEINSCIEDKGRVVSALQRIPYQMTFFGDEIPVAYISGACTDPDYRNRGLMGRLLASAHRRMYDEGKWMSVLIPAEEWLVDYYARSGYVLGFQQHVKLLTGVRKTVDNFSPSLNINKICLNENLPGEVYSYFYEQLRELPFCVQHTEEDFRIILSDWYMGGGECWIAYRGARISALAFCMSCDGYLSVRELLCSDEEVKKEMTAVLALHYDADSMRIVSPFEGEVRRYGMARIINAEKVLGLWACHTFVPHYLEIRGDDAIPENNGFYVVESGKCRREFVDGKNYQKETVAGLAQMIFENRFPYMNLMLD